METYPKIDRPGIAMIAAVIEDKAMLESMHTAAEKQSVYYTLSHCSLKATLADITMHPTERAAMLSGVKAYESLGGVVHTPEELQAYGVDYVMRSIADMTDDRNFILHFLQSLETSQESLLAETPELAEAIAAIASVDMGDPSSELCRRAQMGAAIMRMTQIEIDENLQWDRMLNDID